MKKLLCFMMICLFWGQAFALGKDPLRADDSIIVRNGKIVETGILSDTDGKIFLEFLKDMHVMVSETPVGFNGEILIPEIIEIPQRAPRARMKEVLTFELVTNSRDVINFVDRFALMHPKHRLKEQTANPEIAVQRIGALLLIKFSEEDKVQKPVLWEYRSVVAEMEGPCASKAGEERELCFQLKECKKMLDFERGQCIKKLSWKKIGGKVEQSPEKDLVFSALITRNGIFTIFDENPPVDFTPTFPIDEVELVDQSPFPSVEPLPKLEAEFPFEIMENEFSVLDGEKLEVDDIPPFIEEDLDEFLEEEQEESEVSSQESGEEEEMAAEIEEIEAMNQVDIPEGATLPKSGQSRNFKFPVVLLLALGILGGSGYLALRENTY